MPCQGPGVHALDPDDPVIPEVIVERHARPPVRRDPGSLLDDEPFHPGAPGLDVLVIDPVVADEGIRHGDELSLVRGIRQDLLVARHGRVKDDLTDGLTLGAEGEAFENPAVSESQDRRSHPRPLPFHRPPPLKTPSCWTIRPPTTVIQTKPRRIQPPNGLFRLLEAKRVGSTSCSLSRSRMTRSPSAPLPRCPPGRFRIRAGPTVKRAISVGRSSTPPWTR